MKKNILPNLGLEDLNPNGHKLNRICLSILLVSKIENLVTVVVVYLHTILILHSFVRITRENIHKTLGTKIGVHCNHAKRFIIKFILSLISVRLSLL